MLPIILVKIIVIHIQKKFENILFFKSYDEKHAGYLDKKLLYNTVHQLNIQTDTAGHDYIRYFIFFISTLNTGF